ncbi:MAG: alanine--tRNA ligase [Dehalococcoidales bacterium]|nr:alanine--tRNA ligase [Dehalococcoidales bacterium]
MNSDEIRSAFLEYFKEKGHKVIPSSSLIPKGDPTLLLTSAGMVQIKPYFLGEADPPNPCLASCQKCFRTSDIESVGDPTHNTFFEMLGNFSVGEYFKKEAIAWAWEFVTERMKISTDKLWITIYLDDDEAFKYWREIGIPESKIIRCGEEDNFWGPAGSSGPCGPCSEIHYDFGIEQGCGRPDCQPNCECGRFTELWNLVFPQYNQDESGQRTPLPRPNIDTGMGLERLTAVMAGKKSIYETDLFMPLLDKAGELAGRKYGAKSDDDTYLRVVAEHGRAIAFLIADGVLPDNEGRGYVLRRLLRRAALFGRRLGLDKPFLTEIAKVAIKKMHHVYPELNQRQEFIIKTVTLEETRFEETLNTGLEIIDGLVKKQVGKKDAQISGADAFKLYDTYGFPVELTKEIVAQKDFSVDMEGFEKDMTRQRERARSALLRCSDCGMRLKESDKICPNCGSTNKTRGPIVFDVELKDGIKLSDSVKTEFVGYDCLEQEAKIVKIIIDGKEVNEIKAGQSAGIILDTTPFYGEMGGQVGDTGEIIGKNGKFIVTDSTHIPPDITLHQGEIKEGSLAVGEAARAVVDIERRRDIARNHTATHLLQSALRQVLGDHIQQRGSLVAPEHLRFDFSHLAAMTPDEIKTVQRIVNGMVRQNLPVQDEETDYKKAVEAGAIAIFDEKYGDVVRVLKVGEPTVSAELCGGTHVAYTGEIGYFHILSESSIGAGIRRIEAVTGRGAEDFIDRRFSTFEGAAQLLEIAPEVMHDKLSSMLNELAAEKKRVLFLERELAKHEAASLLERAETVKGVKVLAVRISSDNQQVLRETADYLRDKLKSGIVVLGAVIGGRPMFIAAVTPDLVGKGYNAGDIIKQVSKMTGGGGGGKPNFAQAGGKDKNKLDEALRLVKNLV